MRPTQSELDSFGPDYDNAVEFFGEEKALKMAREWMAECNSGDYPNVEPREYNSVMRDMMQPTVDLERLAKAEKAYERGIISMPELCELGYSLDSFPWLPGDPPSNVTDAYGFQLG